MDATLFTFNLARFDLNTRAYYAARFREVEDAMAGFAGEAQRIIETGDFSAQGALMQLQGPYNDALGAVNARLAAIESTARDDRAAAQAVIDSPAGVPSVEHTAAVQLQLTLVMGEFPAPQAPLIGEQDIVGFGDRDVQLLDALQQAVVDGDAIRAEALVLWADRTIKPSGAGASTIADRRTILREKALLLTADPARRSALELKATLDGTTTDTGVDDKARFVGGAVGPRLTLIMEDDGDDRLVGSFTLDYPLPPGWSRYSSNALSPQWLLQAFGPLAPGKKQPWPGPYSH